MLALISQTDQTSTVSPKSLFSERIIYRPIEWLPSRLYWGKPATPESRSPCCWLNFHVGRISPNFVRKTVFICCRRFFIFFIFLTCTRFSCLPKDYTPWMQSPRREAGPFLISPPCLESQGWNKKRKQKEKERPVNGSRIHIQNTMIHLSKSKIDTCNS